MRPAPRRPASSRSIALAAAPGYGLGWAELNPDAEQPAAEIRLRPEQVVRVRLVDVTGAPAKGVEVRVQGVGRAERQGPVRRRSRSGTSPPEGIRAWPRPVKTDDQGRFAFPGIGRGLSVSLGVRDLRYARQDLYVDPDQARRPPRRSPSRSSRPGSSRAASWPPTPASPSPMPSSRPRRRSMNEHASGYFTAKFRADDQGGSR